MAEPRDIHGGRSLEADGEVSVRNPRRAPGPWPVRALIEIFSSVKLGITMLALLFVYAAIGSAGHYPVIQADGSLGWSRQMVRQLRPFEMTEFEWFHTWVFIGLCAAICVNLTVVTIRKIPFTLPRLGVWMIHTGIVILAIGSVIYFGTKFEGDAPVIRRSVQISIDGVGATSIPAVPGATAELRDRSSGGVLDDGSRWLFEVSDVSPAYTLLSGPNEGMQDFAVTVRAVRPDGREFYRQLLADHPGIVEDAIMVADAAAAMERGERPMQRVRNVEGFGGRLLFDESVAMTLEYEPQEHFWLRDSWAIAIREAGTGNTWTDRPLDGMPRYNDYIASPDEIWTPHGVQRFPIDTMNVPTEPSAGDPFPGLDIRVTGYLRYAVLRERFVPGEAGAPLNPVVDVEAVVDGQGSRRATLVAFDPERDRAFNDLVGFEWVNERSQLAMVRSSLRGAVLSFLVPSGDGTAERFRRVVSSDDIAGEEDGFDAVGDTGWGFKLRQLVEGLEVPGLSGAVSMAEVELHPADGGEAIRRWVFADPRLTRDLNAEGGPGDLDPRIGVEFMPRGADVMIAAGPGAGGVRMLQLDAEGEIVEVVATPGQPVPIRPGINLVVRRVMAAAEEDVRPEWVPFERRNSDADRALSFALANVEVRSGGPEGELLADAWVPYHPYSFEDEALYAAGFGAFQPLEFTTPDGRDAQLIFTRERRELPRAVVLDDFHLKSHVGGFTGETLSIRDWVSDLRFETEDGWGDLVSVRVNHPIEAGGVSFFQSFWDAPRTNQQTGVQTPGKTFTGLGVGNREGVITALLGSTLSVVGMMWAFYVKPVIKRRRQARVMEQLAAQRAEVPA